jgi:kanamycin kinase/aminoglycoside 3'-phosphotransferase-2
LKGKNVNRRFLKVQNADSYEPLVLQKQKLEWIEGKLPVPRVLYYEKTSDREYMITLEVTGYDAASEQCKAELPDAIVTIAKGLKSIHMAPVEDCPYDNSLKKNAFPCKGEF